MAREVRESVWIKGLGPVTRGASGLRVTLDDEAVRTGGERGACEWSYQVATASGERRVDHDGESMHVCEQGHGAEVE